MATVIRNRNTLANSWSVDWTDEDGRRRRKSFTTKLEAETFRHSLSARS